MLSTVIRRRRRPS